MYLLWGLLLHMETLNLSVYYDSLCVDLISCTSFLTRQVKKKTFLIKIIIKINLVNLKLVLSLVSRAFSLLLSLYSASISAHPHNHLHVHTANIGAKETLICLLLGIISTISTSRFPTLHTGTTHAKSFGRFSWLQFWAKHTWGYSVSCWVMFSPAGHPDVSFYLYGCC